MMIVFLILQISEHLLASAFLPGLGEYMLDERKMAGKFFIAEAICWGGFLTLKYYANKLNENAIDFAILKAGAKKGLKEDYYLKVETFMSSEDYNQHICDEARYLYPENRDSQLAYIKRNTIKGDSTWKWGSEEDYFKFRNMRAEARKREMLTSWFSNALLFLRILSVFNVIRIKKRIEVGIAPCKIEISFKFK